MTSIIIGVSVVVIVLGVGVAIWSFIDTRRRYYDEYVKRRKLNG